MKFFWKPGYKRRKIDFRKGTIWLYVKKLSCWSLFLQFWQYIQRYLSSFSILQVWKCIKCNINYNYLWFTKVSRVETVHFVIFCVNFFLFLKGFIFNDKNNHFSSHFYMIHLEFCPEFLRCPDLTRVSLTWEQSF